MIALVTAIDVQRVYNNALRAGDAETAWTALLALENGRDSEAWLACARLVAPGDIELGVAS